VHYLFRSQDDGFFNGDDYPKGGWRPREGVQRGSVMDTDYPGDPLTPGVGATADAKRLALKDAKTITKFQCCRFPGAMRSRCFPPCRDRWLRGMARRFTDHLSLRPGPGEGSSESGFELGF